MIMHTQCLPNTMHTYPLHHLRHLHQHSYISAIIYMSVDLNSLSAKRPFFANEKFFRESFANSMFIFCGAHVEQQLLLWWFIHHLPNDTKISRITSYSLVNMQLASRNPLLRTGCCWLVIFCQAYWATPFKMHFGFRPLLFRTFAELSQTYPYPQTPAISRGRIRGNANNRGLGVWLSQSLTFGSLAAAFGACFLRLQKATLGSTSGRCKGALQHHGIWLWRSLVFGSLAATYEGTGKCTVPFSCRNPGRREW